jgi:hypothetical protein
MSVGSRSHPAETLASSFSTRVKPSPCQIQLASNAAIQIRLVRVVMVTSFLSLMASSKA